MHVVYSEVNQGQPTTECFQIHQKCLRWFFPCLSLGYFGAALKTIYLFGCLGGTLVVSKVLGGFFASSETVGYPDGSRRKFEDIE